MWDYTDKVKEHFLNPRNVGEVENADGIGEVGSMACGDALKLTFKLDEEGRIGEAKFKTFGCASAIASSSALTEMIKGKTLEEAVKLTNDDIARFLGGLPDEKMHCSVMGMEALEAAIAHYNGEESPKDGGEVVCECFGINRQTIEEAIEANGLRTVEQVTNYTKASGGCGNCHDRIAEILAESWKGEAAPVKEKPKLSNLQRMRLVEKTIEEEIRPGLNKDGGDLDLIDVDGLRVVVALRGTCSSCVASQVTLKQFVQSKLREFVEKDIVVVEEEQGS